MSTSCASNSVNVFFKITGILSNGVSPSSDAAVALISSRLVSTCPPKLFAKPLAVAISVSAVSADFFVLSSTSFVGASGDKTAGSGCSIDPQTGHGCPSLSPAANMPACSSR